MAFTFDLANDIGKTRLLIPDNQAATYVFEDAEITALLAMEGGVVKRAAALGLETIASNETLVLKVIRLLDLTTDGAKVSDALLKRAALLREQAATEVEDAASGTGFEIAEQVYDDFGWRELALRGGV